MLLCFLGFMITLTTVDYIFVFSSYPSFIQSLIRLCNISCLLNTHAYIYSSMNESFALQTGRFTHPVPQPFRVVVSNVTYIARDGGGFIYSFAVFLAKFVPIIQVEIHFLRAVLIRSNE